MKKQHKEKLCPYCKQAIVGYPALSRVDNRTEICSECGMLEALKVFTIAKGEKENGKLNTKTNK